MQYPGIGVGLDLDIPEADILRKVKAGDMRLRYETIEKGEGADQYTASTIQDIGAYKGPEPKKDLGIGKPEKKSEDAEEDDFNSEPLKTDPKNADKVAKLNKRLINLSAMHSDGDISDEAFEQGKEQLYSQLEGLEK